jgi:hypothetical protein
LAVSVDRREVERIARLARLSLHDSEADRLALELSRILEHATRLGELAPGPPDEGEIELGDGSQAPSESDGDGAGSLAFAGARVSGAERPERLAVPPEVFAPKMSEGFFVVPPPPGVTAQDAGRSDPDPRR